MPTPNFDLYLVTDRLHTAGRDLLWVLEQALEGGVKAIQLREKDLSGKELFILAEKTRRLCQRYQAALFVNDRLDVALAIDAAGVQLGKPSLPLADARTLLGNSRFIGASVHSLEEAQSAERGGADFLVFGPVYFTPSKAAFGAPQGVPALKKIVEIARIPVYAIGGITPDNITELRSACVERVALISAITEASQPKQAAEEIIRLLRR
ncbi:MAG TPA: thiamine phosphate synthase [Candidatus Binatia bacterium]|nr:thiamine phosphate synthase [Candidatus Binatia bacterium]